MRYSKFAGAIVAAALCLGVSVSTADAAVFAHRSGTAVRGNPGVGRGRAVHHSSTTGVRATPFRPAAGPQVYHRSRTSFFR